VSEELPILEILHPKSSLIHPSLQELSLNLHKSLIVKAKFLRFIEKLVSMPDVSHENLPCSDISAAGIGLRALTAMRRDLNAKRRMPGSYEDDVARRAIEPRR
jgi:hypothetical protein